MEMKEKFHFFKELDKIFFNLLNTYFIFICQMYKVIVLIFQFDNSNIYIHSCNKFNQLKLLFFIINLIII